MIGNPVTAINSTSRKTTDYPDEDRSYSQQFAIQTDVSTKVSQSTIYSSGLKPGQSRTNSNTISTTGLSPGSYFLVTYVWGTDSYDLYPQDNNDTVTISLIAPTSTETPVNTNTPTNTPIVTGKQIGRAHV